MPINYQKTYDTLSYEERAEFQNLTMKVVQEIYPHYSVQPVEPQNPDGIYITNQDGNVRVQFPLRELFTRFVKTAKTRNDLKETILKDFADVFKTIEDTEYFMNLKDPGWNESRDYVQPRLNRIAELPDDPEKYVQTPFGEGVITVVNIVSPDERLVTRVTREMLEKWNISFEELYQKAMDNFADLTDGLELVGTEKPRGCLWNEVGFEYASTGLLLGGLRYLIAQTIGSPYRFGIPSSHRFYCWNEFDDEEFQIEMKALIEREYKSLPSRLSTNIYEVDEQGNMKQLKNQPKIPEKPNLSNN
jgi:hypothetical protein